MSLLAASKLGLCCGLSCGENLPEEEEIASGKVSIGYVDISLDSGLPAIA